MSMLAYELTAHKNPTQVSRLMHAIYSREDLYNITVFGVHSNRKRTEWMNHLKSFEKSNVSIAFRPSNAWGTFEKIKTTVDAMERFRNFDYSHFITLTGQCYPIKPMRLIKETLSKDKRSYMEFTKLPEEEEFVRRLEYCYYRVPNWRPLQLLLKVVIARRRPERPDINTFIKIPRLNKKLMCSFDQYNGSGWFCLHKDHVNYILDFIKDNPDYVKFFSKVLIPEEHFFHTILLNSPHKSQIVNDCYRYIVWPGPKILCTEDINDIVNSEKLFARKFDIEIDSNVLDLLDLNNRSPHVVHSKINAAAH